MSVGHISSCIGGKDGDTGGEVDDPELMLVGRLIRPPNDPNKILWVGQG